MKTAEVVKMLHKKQISMNRAEKMLIEIQKISAIEVSKEEARKALEKARDEIVKLENSSFTISWNEAINEAIGLINTQIDSL